MSDLLEDVLVDQLGWSDADIESLVSLTDGLYMLELLVEHIVHLNGVSLELVDLEDRAGEANCMLESCRCQLFVLHHERIDVVEVTVNEACDHLVLVVVDPITVKVFVTSD